MAPGYNEGWNAFQADRAVNGGPLYPPPSDLSSNNYPPLSFYVVGLLGQAVGDYILAGRGLSLFSLLIVALNVAYISRRMGAGRSASAVASVFFLGHQAIFAHRYVALNDPQWFAHAVMTTGLAVFLSGPRSAQRLWATAALMVAAGMVKHLLIAAPLAVTLYLALFERERLRQWLLASAALLTGAVAGCVLAFGPDFLHNVLFSPRLVSLYQAAPKLNTWFIGLQAPALGAVLLAAYGRSRTPPLLFLLVAAAVAEIALAIGGIGVNENAAFDLVIALAIGSGLVLEWLRASRLPHGQTIALASLALPFLLSAPDRMLNVRNRSATFAAETAQWSSEIERLRRINGPVACETLSLCYWAGKGFEVDFFSLGQRVDAKQLDARTVALTMAQKRIAAVQIVAPQGRVTSGRLPGPLNEELALVYEPCGSAIRNTNLLVRRAGCHR